MTKANKTGEVNWKCRLNEIYIVNNKTICHAKLYQELFIIPANNFIAGVYYKTVINQKNTSFLQKSIFLGFFNELTQNQFLIIVSSG